MAVPRYVRHREDADASLAFAPAEGIPLVTSTVICRPRRCAPVRKTCRADCVGSAVRRSSLAVGTREVAEHLRERRVDVMPVPGLSGHPIGALYSAVAGIPAILLKKEPAASRPDGYPTGSFIVSSYTGEGDHVLSADLVAAGDTIDAVLAARLADRGDHDVVRLPLRLAGADDIIDKGVMSTAVSDSAVRIARSLGARFVARHRELTGDSRDIRVEASVCAWVTPMLKAYHNAGEVIERFVGIKPFAGLRITDVRTDPPAIGVAGFGYIEFGDEQR